MQIRRTKEFIDWVAQLRDREARVRILTRIDRLTGGNPGQTRSVGSGVVEMKIDYGPGYRVYFIQKGDRLILLLCGGDRSSQEADIRRARELAGMASREE
jgi:putative addiction module killer protein